MTTSNQDPTAERFDEIRERFQKHLQVAVDDLDGLLADQEALVESLQTQLEAATKLLEKIRWHDLNWANLL